MFVGNGMDIFAMLQEAKGKCPKCGKDLTFKTAAGLAKENNISENVVMCGGCNRVFEINLVPGRMTLTNDVTAKYPQVKAGKGGGLFSKLFKK